MNIEHWTSRDGLSNSQIESITQTKDGALWLGTVNGLVRFDGTKFTAQSMAGLASLPIKNLGTGPDSQLYVGTERGLTVVRLGEARTFQQYTQGIFTKVTTVLPVGEDEAWFGTTVGVLYRYTHSSVWEAGSGVLPHEPIYGLAKAPDGTLWVASSAGLYVLANGQLTPYQTTARLPHGPFYDLAAAQDGTIFAASAAGLLEIHGRTWKLWTERDGLPANAIHILNLDPLGVLWIGTQRGLAKLEKNVLVPVRGVSCDVHSLFADREKSVWTACENTAGLTRVTFPPVRFLGTSQFPGAAVISTLAEAPDGSIWMGSGDGLFRYQQRHITRYTTRDGLPGNEIGALSISSTGTLWVATQYGLASFVNGRFHSLDTDAARHLNVFFAVLQDVHGTLWVTSEEGLLRKNAGQPSFESVPGFKNTIAKLRQDREGGVWISTKGQGLFRFAGTSQTAWTEASGLGSNDVLDSAEDDTGTVWVWTKGGLSRIRGGRCASTGPATGLPPAVEGSVAYDHNNHLWLRTQDGVAVVDIVDANRVMDAGGSLQNTRYFERDGAFGDMLSNSPKWSPVVMRSTGEIWVPTLAGVAIVDQSVLQQPFRQLAPQMTSVITDEGARNLSATIRVRPDDQHLVLAYSAPYLLEAAEREYRYRLSGLDPAWRDNGNRKEAIFTALPAGKYQFQVSTRMPFEAWSEPSNPVSIIVLPHFYQTWWWFAFLVAVLCMMLTWGYQLRLRALRRQYSTMLSIRSHERSRLARELHDTLSRGAMSIHVQLQLARTFMRSDPETASSHLDTAESINRQSASETRRSIAALRSDASTATNLGEVLREAALRFSEESAILLEITIEEDLCSVSPETGQEIARIVEEALCNVRLHSQADRAFLTARCFGKHLRVEVIDNGKGFDSLKVDRTFPARFGLTGMKERAEYIQGALETSSTVGKGTRVVLEVPCSLVKRRRADGKLGQL